MTESAIQVENLGKQYRIGERENIGSLRDVVAGTMSGIQSKISSILGNQSEDQQKQAEEQTIWALKDVSFEVNHGEVVGVIGRNGAGKSTLLKVLSRITNPTEGRAVMNGRVGSLLEVGTGFHGELTGRENVFMSGAVLGMSRTEIEDKYDEIVEFAGVEEFMDTPVKRYSSGMSVRLGFAVAAHLDPEILLIDEVLAVGDAGFQEKCLGKMDDVAGQGRTVLFVSHNMDSIRKLTDRCILLEEGEIQSEGNSSEVVDEYLSRTIEHREKRPGDLEYYQRESGTPPVRITDILINGTNEDIPELSVGSSVNITYHLQSDIDVEGVNISFQVIKEGRKIFHALSWDDEMYVDLEKGETVLTATIEELNLLPGFYYMNFGVNKQLKTKAWHVIQDYPGFRITRSSNQSMIQYAPDRMGMIYKDDVHWKFGK